MSDEIPPVPKHNNSDQGGNQSCDDIKSFVDFFPSERVKGVCVVVLDVHAVWCELLFMSLDINRCDVLRYICIYIYVMFCAPTGTPDPRQVSTKYDKSKDDFAGNVN